MNGPPYFKDGPCVRTVEESENRVHTAEAFKIRLGSALNAQADIM